jgi:hypothetical protein
MKASVLTLLLCAALGCSIAAQTSVPKTSETAQSEKDIYPRWSIVGDWNVTHPVWTDVITFRKDGTLVTKNQRTTGRWVLTADAGTPLLVLRWDDFGTESLMMVGQDHFRGQIAPGSFIDMRRGAVAHR